MAVLGFVGLITFGLYLQKLAINPLGVALSGEHKSRQLGLLRNSATAGFAGHYWRYNFAMSFILPLASWYFLCRSYCNERHRRLDQILFLLFFTASIYAAVVSLQKFPLLIYVVITTFVLFEIRRKNISFSALAILGTVLAALTTSMYALFEAVKEPLLQRLLLGANRTVVGQVYPALAYLDLFPHRTGYLLGQTFPNPRGVLPFVPFDFTHLGWTYLFPQHAHGLYGTANTMYFMEWYVNFGYLGMYVIAPLTGCLIMFIGRGADAISVRELRIPASYLLASLFFRLSLTDLFQVFQEMILVLCMIVGLWLCARVAENKSFPEP
jgi:oligosaccharide repeat unit polymerase